MFQNVLQRVSFGRRAGVALAIVGLAFTAGAQANIVTPGGPPAAPDVFVSTGLTLLATTGLTPFTGSLGKVTGNYIAAVYRDTNTGVNANPFGVGDLDFLYQVFVSSTSPDAINRVTAVDFTGFSTDAGYTASGASIGGVFVNGTVVPQLVDRNSADTVGFSYNAPQLVPIQPGSTSVVMIIKTNATNFKAGNVNFIDGGTTTLAAFAPSSTVPEPASLALMGAGLLALAGIRKFRRQ